MATIRKRVGVRGTRWECRVRIKGGTPFSKTFGDRKSAQKWSRLIETALEQGEIPVGSDVTERIFSMRQLLERYRDEVCPQKKCGRKEASRINNLLRSALADTRVESLTAGHIAKYRDSRLREIAPASVLRDLQLLSHAIEIGRREWGLPIPQNPVKAIRKPAPPKARDRRLKQEEDEERRLLVACGAFSNQWFLPVVHFAIETGMRRGEILSLQWRDVHLDRRYVHLRDTKNGDSRDVPLSPKAIVILQQLHEKGSSNRMNAVFPIHFEALKSAWRRAVAKAGIDGLRFHDLRHEATSRFFEKGLNVMEVAAITGHKDLRMLQRYTHLRAEDLAKKLLTTLCISCGHIQGQVSTRRRSG